MKSKLAIASFVLGIMSLLLVPYFLPIFRSNFLSIKGILSWILFNPIYPLLGLIFGVISIFSIKKNNLKGIWFAIFGIFFSLAGIIAIVWFILAISAFMRSGF